ncbi:Thioredoxin [Solitalea koreensis]|uniref:Thioredoxin n=2 Tax=Solitalea koreensis TaxID=543615 RepID=A0A521C2Y8_9SPHI|nr:Thioredoxin [Solitalea koreensis]
MKGFFFSICCMFASIVVNAQDRAINFEHGTWAEIKAKAAKEKKVIFLDCFTSWCGPCKKLAKEVFTLNEVADYYNANFINASMDMEKGEGPQLAKQYGIRAYPSLLFVTPEGKLISKNEGASDFKTFIDYGKKAVSGESLESLTAEYKKGNRSPEFMKKYMTRMEGIKANTTEIIGEYFSKIPQAQWQTAENWYFINRYVRTEQSSVFKYVLQNQKAYEKKFTAEAVSDYFVMVYGNSIQKAANGAFPAEDLKELKDGFLKMNFAGAGKLALQCDAAASSVSKDMKAYADVMEVIFAKYPEKKIDDRIVAVGSFCWKILNQSSDQYVLQKATKLAELSMQVQNPEFMDVYARLLVETGNFDKGIEVEEKVIAMLKAKPNPDVSLTACEDRLEKFKRRKG